MIDGLLEFTYRPPLKRKAAAVWFSVLLFAGAAGATASVLSPKFKGLISLAAIIAIVGAIVVFVRYMSGAYAYAVIYADDFTPILVVTKITGKRVSTLGNFSLSAILQINKITQEQKRNEKGEVGVRKYNLCPNLSPETLYKLTVRGREESADVYLEGSDEFFLRLREYSAKAREYAILNEEE